MEETHRIGVDVGGTFTDVVTVADGEIAVTKVPSTPNAPADGVHSGIEAHLESTDLAPDQIGSFGHGTTVATNAVLEREWADTALITTAGFRDILEIGRQDRPELYDLSAQKPDPIVPRANRYGVPERIDHRGAVEVALDQEALETVITAIESSDVESVAICCLFAYENDTHERAIEAALTDRLPDITVTRSSAVLPEVREFERSVTTALNAALTPIMGEYLGMLTAHAEETGIGSTPRIMLSHGGSVGPTVARNRPVTTLLSGPAAGVMGAAQIASASGYPDVLTMDMGGTSCDVSLVTDSETQITTDGAVGPYRVGMPMVDVHTIGAGGGSIAWIDDGGAIRVGPRSAGAVPGPIAYGRGGEHPTVTDAHVVLGRVNPTTFDAKTIAPDPAGARNGIARTIAEPLDMEVEEAAAGILTVANAAMERALRVVSVERGHDPRDFALVAFGGAGPLHASAIAASLDIPTVLVPPTAGVLSAYGLVIADVSIENSLSRVRPWSDVEPTALEERFVSLSENGIEQLQADGFSDEEIRIERAVDLRYVGQSFSLRVPIESSAVSASSLSAIADRFHARYRQRYGHAASDEAIELVTQRVVVRGDVPPPDLEYADMGGETEPSPRTYRSINFDTETHDTPVYDRTALRCGTELAGPILIEGSESTIVLEPDDSLEIDTTGTLCINVGGANS